LAVLNIDGIGVCGFEIWRFLKIGGSGVGGFEIWRLLQLL